MKLLARIILQIFSNCVAIFLAAKFISGFIFTGDLRNLLLAALILTLINIFLRPLLKLFFGPFIILTFGLFTLVLNALLLYILDFLLKTLTIEGYTTLFYASLLIGVVNFVIGTSGKMAYKE